MKKMEAAKKEKEAAVKKDLLAARCFAYSWNFYQALCS